MSTLKACYFIHKTRNSLINSWKLLTSFRSSHPEVFLRKVILKICSKFPGEHPCPSVISIKLLCNFAEITLWHGCSPVNLLHIFRTPFPKNTSGRPLLILLYSISVIVCLTLICLFVQLKPGKVPGF